MWSRVRGYRLPNTDVYTFFLFIGLRGFRRPLKLPLETIGGFGGCGIGGSTCMGVSSPPPDLFIDRARGILSVRLRGESDVMVQPVCPQHPIFLALWESLGAKKHC